MPVQTQTTDPFILCQEIVKELQLFHSLEKSEELLSLLLKESTRLNVPLSTFWEQERLSLLIHGETIFDRSYYEISNVGLYRSPIFTYFEKIKSCILSCETKKQLDTIKNIFRQFPTSVNQKYKQSPLSKETIDTFLDELYFLWNTKYYSQQIK